MKTVYTYGKLGYVAKLEKNGVCIGTWISSSFSILRDQVEAWKTTNLK